MKNINRSHKLLIIIICSLSFNPVFCTYAAAFEIIRPTDISVWSGITDVAFEGGDGTESNPYQIATGTQLALLSERVNAGNTYAGVHFVMINDIDLEDAAWTAIGSRRLFQSSNKPFSGVFDGAEYNITGLYIENTTGIACNGLFAYINGAKIKNVTIYTGTRGVNGNNYVGGLVGYAENSYIDNCSVSGTVTSKVKLGSYYKGGTGGLIGGAKETEITNCTTDITVTGEYNTGGLLGLSLTGCVIDSCSVQGTVSGTETLALYVGGLIGHIYLDKTYVGGTEGVSVSRSTTDVKITSYSNEVGGLIGKIFIEAGKDSEVTVIDCLAYGDVTGMGTTSAYFGGLIGVVWDSAENAHISVIRCSAYGDVWLGYYVGGGLIGYAYGNITVDDCHAHGNITSGTLGASFSRELNGQDSGGLIGLTDGVNAAWDGVFILNSHSSGDIMSSGYQIGGFIGEAYAFTNIHNCYAAGNVLSTYNYWEYLYDGVGGFIGNIAYGGVSVNNCYAVGSVVAVGTYQVVGGFVGRIYYSIATANDPIITFSNCYSTGTVQGLSSTGGFIGRINPVLSKAMLRNCYFDVTTAGTSIGIAYGSDSVDGMPNGLTTDKMTDAESIDFSFRQKGDGTNSNPWYIDNHITYPYFFYQYDGHSAILTDYTLGSAEYYNVHGDWELASDRMNMPKTQFDPSVVSFNVSGSGAARVYFPYSRTWHNFIENTVGITVNNAWNTYSLGSVSKTNIIAFSNGEDGESAGTEEPGDGEDGESGGTEEPDDGEDGESGGTEEPDDGEDGESGGTEEPGDGEDGESGGTEEPGDGEDGESGGTEEPDDGEDRESGGTEEPDDGEDGESGGTEEPDDGEDGESGGTEEPGDGEDGESGGTEDPGDGEDGESGGTEEPGDGEDGESGGTEEPSDGEDGETGGTEEPDDGEDGESGGTEEPGDGEDGESGGTEEPSDGEDGESGGTEEPGDGEDGEIGVTEEPGDGEDGESGGTEEPDDGEDGESGGTEEPGDGEDGEIGVTEESGDGEDGESGGTEEPDDGEDGEIGVTEEPGDGEDGEIGVTEEPGDGMDGEISVTEEPGDGMDGEIGVTEEPGDGMDGEIGVTEEPGDGMDGEIGVTEEPGDGMDGEIGVTEELSDGMDGEIGVTEEPGDGEHGEIGVTEEPGDGMDGESGDSEGGTELEIKTHFAYIVGYPDGTVRPERCITRAETACIFFRLLTEESRINFRSDRNDYPDVQNDDWYNSAVSTLTNGGILSGYANGRFVPKGAITRAEFATIIMRFATAEVYNKKGVDFHDVKGHWAENYIIQASDAGYIAGYTDNTFRPDMPIIRAEAIALVNNLLKRGPLFEVDLLPGMIIWPDNKAGRWYHLDIQEATNSHTYVETGSQVSEKWVEILEVSY